MAKNSITDYSKTAASNTDIQSVDIDEGCLPSGINNAIREIMADLADVNDGTVSLTSPSFAAASLTGDLSFGDNNKAIFGAGSDLQIYHDGSDNHIVANTSNLNIGVVGGGAINLGDKFGNTLLQINDNADVKLFYGTTPAEKLATTATGVDVTGTVTADGLSVGIGDYLILDGGSAGEIVRTPIAGTVTIESRGSVDIYGDSNNNGAPTSAVFRVLRDSTYEGGTAKTTLNITDNGDISFYEDTGTTAKLFWDASAERLGLRTTSPSATLDLVLPSPAASASSGGIEITEGTKTFALSTTGSSYNYAGVGANELWYYGNSNFGAFTFGSDGAVPIKFISNGSERARLDSSGNFMVGGTISNPAFSNTSGAISLRGVVGTIEASRDAGSALELNRKTDDGAIINLRKDGTTVGVIGTQNWGIGTSSPAAKIDSQEAYDTVSNILTNGTYAAKFGGNTAVGAAGRAQGIMISGRSGNTRGAAIIAENQGSGNGHDLLFATSADASTPAERLRITDAGLVGIGTSSPARTFHIHATQPYLHMTSAATGTTSSDGLSILVGQTNGEALIIQRENQPIQIYTNSTERMRIDSSGRVGIGTTSPASPLHIQADGVGIRIDGTADATKTVFLRNTGTGEGQFHTDGNMHFIQEDAGKYMRFSTANTERMRIDSSGNTTITAAGNPTLTLKGSDGAYSPFLVLQAAGGGGSVINAKGATSNSLSVQIADSEKMRIDSSGNAMLAKSSTNTLGTVGHDFGVTGYAMHTRASSNVLYLNRTTSDGNIAEFYKDSTTVGSIGVEGGDNFYITDNNNTGLNMKSGLIIPCNTNGSTRDTAIDLGASTGRFKDLHLSGTAYVGTSLDIKSTSSAPTIRIHADTTSSPAPAIELQRGTNDTWGADIYSDFRIENSVGALKFFEGSDGVTSEFMRLENDADLHVDGNVVAYSTTVSDIRLKKDIAPIEDAVTKVQQLNGCTFTYLKDDRQSAGLIAQDVEKVLPSAVIEDKAVFHGEEGETYKTVQYDQLIGLLVEAVKELTAKVEELENASTK